MKEIIICCQTEDYSRALFCCGAAIRRCGSHAGTVAHYIRPDYLNNTSETGHFQLASFSPQTICSSQAGKQPSSSPLTGIEPGCRQTYLSVTYGKFHYNGLPSFFVSDKAGLIIYSEIKKHKVTAATDTPKYLIHILNCIFCTAKARGITTHWWIK
ncbi:MAG: hypothetical protein K0Q77_1962 [Anaerosporomusa subterranea]|nr:hypothetical protein [Anaerosporomusa subterranea]